MSHFLQVCTENKALVSALLALLLSEILPFVKSTQWNGLLQGIVASLKKDQPK